MQFIPVIRSVVIRAPPQDASPDVDIWHKVIGKRSRSRSRLPCPSRWMHGQVPKVVQGRCFNYLAMTHKADRCKNRTRCFRCLALRHRAPFAQWRPDNLCRSASSIGVTSHRLRQALLLLVASLVRLLTTPLPMSSRGGSAMDEAAEAHDVCLCRRRSQRRPSTAAGRALTLNSDGGSHEQAFLHHVQIVLTTTPDATLPEMCFIDVRSTS